MMTLSSLIRKRPIEHLATAIPATSAIRQDEESSTEDIATAIHAIPATTHDQPIQEIAKIATIAVANPWEVKNEEWQASRHERVEEMLAASPDRKYAVLVDDSVSDPVTVTVGIRRIAVFDLQIPIAHYDGLALLEVIEQYSTEA